MMTTKEQRTVLQELLAAEDARDSASARVMNAEAKLAQARKDADEAQGVVVRARKKAREVVGQLAGSPEDEPVDITG